MSDKKLNLVLHCGGQEVSESDVYDVDTPNATDTWQPISHQTLIETVVNNMALAGLVIQQAIHGLWKDGDRYFGLMGVQAEGVDPSDDYSLVLGLRNSHDKSFPAALALGAGVFVCDNLSFSGEIKLARRHTKNILRDLPEVVTKALGRLGDLRNTQERRIEAYQNTSCDDKSAHDFVIRAIDSKVIGPTRIKNVLEQWRQPKYDEFSTRDCWSLFNAFTEAMKPKRRDGANDNNNLIGLPAQTTKLHGLMDQQCGLIIDVKRDETLG